MREPHWKDVYLAGNNLEKRCTSLKDGTIQVIKLENINCAKYILNF